MRMLHYSCQSFCRFLRTFCLFVQFVLVGISCMDFRTDASVSGQADSLNVMAYHSRFGNPAAADSLARQAMSLAHDDSEVSAFSLLMMAYHSYSTMDYDGADSLYSQVYRLTRNEITRLAADVGLMRVCQLTARGKDFYDHRENALARIRHIREEIGVLTPSDLDMFIVVESEFHMVMAAYYCYFGQRDKAIAEMDAIDEKLLEQTHPSLWAHCLLLRGAEGLCPESDNLGHTLQRFDYLGRALLLARRANDELLAAGSLQALASLMLEPGNADSIPAHRAVTLHRITGDLVADAQSLAMDFADEAVRIHWQQDNRSLLINSYSTLAACLIDAGKYAEAVDTLSGALDIIVEHHRIHYTCDDSLHHLPTYSEVYMPAEIMWTKASATQTVPEWILNIREQLSLAYAGMDMKAQSDYNRNIYLDLLELVRQDKELESRYATLQNEERDVRIVLWIAVGVLLLILLLFLAIAVKQKSLRERQLKELEKILSICRHRLASDDVPSAGEDSVSDSLHEMAGKLLEPYYSWMRRNELWQNAIEEERVNADEQHALHLHRMQTNKRENMTRRTSLSLVQGIVPLIDRLMHEAVRLRKMSDGISSAGEPFPISSSGRNGIYTYMRELIHEISVSNELMTTLIQMRRGNLSLHVETFPLSELMEIVAKGHTSFERKHIALTVVPTDCVIKADKALTLFMMNTLLDNARKYTPSGGSVRIEAVRTGQDVEIMVSDTGPGIPEEDIRTILNEKYYDSRHIGHHDRHFEEVSKQKGSGFGLMNCKGIIEKYRKSSPLFERVAFKISNRSEGGLSVSFILPLVRSVRSSVVSILCLFLFLVPGVADHSVSAATQPDVADSLLGKASYFADQAYFCNVERLYRQSLTYIDSSFACLNEHHALMADTPDTAAVLSLTVHTGATELDWLADGFFTDYHILLDLRNEASVAFLGLHKWKEYRYNNQIYTDLYKQLSRDTSLDAYCVRLNRSSSAKSMAVFFILLLILVCLVIGYLLYMRGWMAYRFHLRQMVEVNRHLYGLSSHSADSTPDADKVIDASQILSVVWEGISDIFSLRSMALMIVGEDGHVSSYAYCPGEETAETFRVRTYMDEYMSAGALQSGVASDFCWKGDCLLIPLLRHKDDESERLGVLAIIPEKTPMEDEGLLMARMLQAFLSAFVHHSVSEPARQLEYTSRAMDDANRNRHEEMRLYVQNTVLDNCLSTIKHETMFYPTRISQILDNLLSPDNTADEHRLIAELAELVTYYREVYVLLATYALRQSDEVAFHRTIFPVSELLQYASKYHEKRVQTLARQFPGEKFPILQISTSGDATLHVSGDSVTLCYLVANLIDEAVACHHDGELRFSAFEQGEFIRFEFWDKRRSLDTSALNNLFSLEHLKGDAQGTPASGSGISGMEFLICRQIIREHDEYMGHPGCRINAEPADGEDGYLIWFTIPKGYKKHG